MDDKNSPRQSLVFPASSEARPKPPIDLFSIGILNSLSAHICVVDVEGYIVAINRSWTQFGLENGGEPQSLNEGANYFSACLNAVDHDGIAEAAKALDGIKAVLTGRESLFEMEYDCHSPEEERWFLMRATPMQFRGPKAVVSHINITDKKRAEEERLKLENYLLNTQKIESIGQLAGGVAHEFNNMLAIIVGNAELAQMKFDPDGELQGQIKEILAAANRSKNITQQLLAFARKQIAVTEVLDLNRVIEELLKMLRWLLGENINLVWQPGVILWQVEMDPSHLNQILTNLCVNAREAIDDVGQVIIQTRNTNIDVAACETRPGLKPGDYVQITVMDNGCGMAEEIQQKVFEPFFTTKELGQGSGLGLAAVYGAVKQSNGYIDVESKLGEGTRFDICLPRHRVEETEEQKAVNGEGYRGRGETILLVDDEAAVLGVTKGLLQELGYRVLAASSPAEALSFAKARCKEIDLLLTDVIMPEMNGRELFKQLQPICPDLECVYMYGYPNGNLAPFGELPESAFFVQKPFSRIEVGSILRNALDLKN